MQSSYYSNSLFEFGEKTRKITLPDSDDPSDVGHSIRIVNKADSELLIRTSGKNWKLQPRATGTFSYDGSRWIRKGAAPVKKVACPPDDSCSSSSSCSDDDCCKRGPRGYPGRDGCPGANGLNGLNGKNGKCECRCSQTVVVQYSGEAATYETVVQVPCWAKSTLVTSVGGGGSGGIVRTIEETTIAGSGGGSGFSITQPIPTAGGFLSLSIGQGGQVSSNGNPTVVTYTGTLPYAVYAPGGHAGGDSAVPPINLDVSSGQYGGGGGDGNPVQSPPGSGFESGEIATHDIKGGDGGGYQGGLGGVDNVASAIYGGGGGGSAPGPIAAFGGRGGGYSPASLTPLNGTSGSYGSGGGGAGVQGGSAPAVGIPGVGGNGYVIIVFSA